MMELAMEDQDITGMVQITQQKDRQRRARWTAFLTEVLVGLMVDQVCAGNRKNNAFNKKAWSSISDGFLTKTGLKWDKEQLKNRYSVLRRQYALVMKLLGRSEFTLDQSTGNFIASDKSWAEFKGHPDAENIRVNGCPIYKQLCFVFSKWTTDKKNDPSAEFHGTIPSSLPCLGPLGMIHEQMSSEYEEAYDMADNQEFLPDIPSSITMRKRGRKSVDGSIAKAIQEMAAASKLRMAAVNHYDSRYSIATCIRELDAMKLVDEEVYLAALVLFNNPNARETFLSLKCDKRLIWLYRKCANPSTALCFKELA